MSTRICHFLAITLAVLALSFTLAAQKNPPAECPTIVVTGPAGIPIDGELIPYHVQLRGIVPDGVTYNWTVSTGKVVEGHGTDKVKIDAPDWTKGVSLIATVEILGLQDGCPNTASEAMAVTIDPGPIHLSTIRDLSTPFGKIREMMEELEKNPNSQGYIFIGIPTKTELHEEIEDAIRESALRRGVDPARLTFVRKYTAKEVVEIWRVPPGANNPLCRACEPLPKDVCPKITLTGPAGQIHLGDTAMFTINADLDMKGLKFQWTVSAGTITSGQGKPWIEVQSDPMSSNDSIIATVEISGLPDGCKNLASETAHIKKPGHPIPLDEYERISVKEELERLDTVAAAWKTSRHWYLYVILYLAPKETSTSERARVKRIKDHLTRTQKIPEERLVFVSGGIFQRSTKIYGVAEALPKQR